ncbi:apoptosis-inducing factor A [Staphylotrichum tortipilum]|uniref:Apoptosis-inducing factor A n=1 Tax=Staphylotrichum tortipilum TaxID=2831512 RepID=A0AAN6MQQ5_9PEZI|nr:apoptosis-inducing factor A [Staphylotrichum longicolle]
MAAGLRNVVVVGGSYVGMNTAKELANLLPATHRVLLVEPHSHFHHLFAFPRFAISPGHEHKAFIPFTSVFSGAPSPSRHLVARARAVALHPHSLTLDREWQGSRTLPFDFLVVATGTRLSAPGTMPADDKAPSVHYLQAYQAGIRAAREVLVIGGGAVGVQMACDLKEIYPEKRVTLVHSREKLMPAYHEALSGLVKERFEELGVELVTGARAVLPPADGEDGVFGAVLREVKLSNGATLTADFVIRATGQTPNTQFLGPLQEEAEEELINPQNGFIRVLPTLQFADPRYPHLFAVGDVADTGAHKAARPGALQAAVAAKNVAALVEGREAAERLEVAGAGIHLTLGLTKNVIFRNPDVKEGATEPVIKLKDDGREDMGIEGVWMRRGVTVASPQEYHL